MGGGGMRGDTRFPPNTLPGNHWPTGAIVCFSELNGVLQVKCCPHLAFTAPAPARIPGESRPGGREQEWDRQAVREPRPPRESEGRQTAMLGWRRGAAGQRPARALTRGTTHCSSSRPRRPHSPQTGCSGWSSQCRCRPGSETRPHRRLSLEQRPPGTIRPGSPHGGQSSAR